MRKRIMRDRIMKMKNGKKRYAARLAAGALGFMLAACTLPAGTRTVYALEEAEADAAKGSIIETETEAPEDAIISAAAQSAVNVLSTGADGSIPMELLPEDIQQTLQSLDAEEITEYAIMIERILKNPDFQSMMQYDEVRDLLVTLVHNALDMASEDPILTGKVLETMGVNRNMIIFFYAILEARSNSEVPEEIENFLLSDKGHELTKLISQTLDPATLDQLLSIYGDALQKYNAQQSAEQETLETETENGN